MDKYVSLSVIWLCCEHGLSLSPRVWHASRDHPTVDRSFVAIAIGFVLFLLPSSVRLMSDLIIQGLRCASFFLNWGNFWNTLILRTTCHHRIFFFFYISFLFFFFCPRFCFSIFRRETHRRSDGIHYRPEAWASLLVFMADCWQAVCVIKCGKLISFVATTAAALRVGE